MAIFTIDQMKSEGKKIAKSLHATSDSILSESYKFAKTEKKQFDIFLSHSYQDADMIFGLKQRIEQLTRKSVYVDWIADKQLDRERVTTETADTLRKRMKDSRCLLYVTTTNSINSKWMPWELGYFDALKGKVAIVPVLASNPGNRFNGQEYLGLYSYITYDNAEDGSPYLWVHDSGNKYVNFDHWLDKDTQPYTH